MFHRATSLIKGSPNSIAELREISLGGTRQWIQIRGVDRRKPLLLFLHGGPGMPLISISSKYFRLLEQNFVVVNWDQRGSGLSRDADTAEAFMTVEQFVSDATDLTRMLLRRFHREKLFLVGHSWGSAIGTLTVHAHPELFYAYLGAGQIADMAENEVLEYQNLMEYAVREKDSFLLEQLEKLGPPPYRDVEKSLKLRTGFTFRYLDDYKEQGRYKRSLMRTALSSTEYSPTDLVRYLGAHLHSVKELWTKLVETNLFELAPKLEVPCFFVLGRHDIVVLPQVTERYIQQLEAPVKELIWFDTGHSMQYETPELFQRTIIKAFRPYRPAYSAREIYTHRNSR